jgi:uncharacterized protein (TIGR03437 family)
MKRCGRPLTGRAARALYRGFFGSGQGSLLNQGYSINSSRNPAAHGSIVLLYATGEGQTDPAGVDRLLATVGLPQPRVPVSITTGGIRCPKLLYAGAAPGFVAGSMKINARIPANAPNWVLSLSLSKSQLGTRPVWRESRSV